MKKPKPQGIAELRPEYRKDDFPAGLVRGKYRKAGDRGSNIVVLDPMIAAAFPTSQAVNEALGVVLKAARSMKKAKPARRMKSKS